MPDSAHISDIVKPMLEAALKAAHIALLRRKEGVHVHIKRDGSKVTNGDFQAELIIRDTLQLANPKIARKIDVNEIGFLMEESLDGQHHDFAGRNHGAKWVVDPIDGTFGYAQPMGERPEPWAVSIALEKNGKTIAGVVYEAAEHEYGNNKADYDAIDPAHPKGKIYWADQNVAHTHVLDGSEGGFSINSSLSEIDYAALQAKTAELIVGKHGLTVLDKYHAKIAVSYSKAIKYSLDRKRKVIPGAKAELDDFFQDIPATPGELPPLKKQLCDACDAAGIAYNHLYSAVAGAMRAADGRASAYMSGQGFPWDHSAARLILMKSDTPMVEYAVPGSNGERSMLIAGRDAKFMRFSNPLAGAA